jgi:hypothetical protein
LGPAGDRRGFFISPATAARRAPVMKDRGHVGIFLARHGVRFCQGAGSRRRFAGASSGSPRCASRCEAASSAVACSESNRPRKADRNTSAYRMQSMALASAGAITGLSAGRRPRVIFNERTDEEGSEVRYQLLAETSDLMQHSGRPSLFVGQPVRLPLAGCCRQALLGPPGAAALQRPVR